MAINTSEVAELILTKFPKGIVCVGIDGCTASGKSTLAKALVKAIRIFGRPVAHVALDDFHNEKKIRYQMGRQSAEGYYHYAFNYGAIRDQLLKPLRSPQPSYSSRWLDLANDVFYAEEPIRAEPNTILIAEGSFAFRKELVEYWDFRIFLSTPEEVCLERASIRDAQLFGSREEAARITKSRYIAAYRIYCAEENPKERADMAIDN